MGISATVAVDAGTDIRDAVYGCLEAEKELGLAERSLRTCGQYLDQFAQYCLEQGVTAASELTTALVTGYIGQRGASGGPALIKLLVWSIRKFCAYLCLRGILPQNPARDLRHPPIPPRARLLHDVDVFHYRTVPVRRASDAKHQALVVRGLGSRILLSRLRSSSESYARFRQRISGRHGTGEVRLLPCTARPLHPTDLVCVHTCIPSTIHASRPAQRRTLWPAG